MLLFTGFVLEILTGMCILAQYVMVVLKGSVPMAFGGTQQPAAYGELVSIGGLNPDVNKKLSAGIASILESKLSIPKSRFYLKFYDSKARRNYGFFLIVY
jgi:phenylpyruvate tautomerase